MTKMLNSENLLTSCGMDPHQSAVTADKILYDYAIEQCQSAALDELFGNPGECFQVKLAFELLNVLRLTFISILALSRSPRSSPRSGASFAVCGRQVGPDQVQGRRREAPVHPLRSGLRHGLRNFESLNQSPQLCLSAAAVMKIILRCKICNLFCLRQHPSSQSYSETIKL